MQDEQDSCQQLPPEGLDGVMHRGDVAHKLGDTRVSPKPLVLGQLLLLAGKGNSLTCAYHSFISVMMSRLYDVVVMIFNSKELNLLRCLAKSQGWVLRVIKMFRTYSIELMDKDSKKVLLRSPYEDIGACAKFLLKRIGMYRCGQGGWYPTNIRKLFDKIPEFKTFDELELNLVLMGSYSANLDYEIRPKSFKRSKRIYIVE